MHWQEIKLSNELGDMQLQENTLFYLRATQNVAQYPQHCATYVPV